MFLIVSSTFDKTGQVITGLQESCTQYLIKNDRAYDLIEVPGAVEIPIAVQEIMLKDPQKYQAAIALGCIIKGETDHYEWVMKAAQEGLTQVALKLGKPVIQGVLACPDEASALARKALGAEYAHTAVSMTKILS